MWQVLGQMFVQRRTVGSSVLVAQVTNMPINMERPMSSLMLGVVV